MDVRALVRSAWVLSAASRRCVVELWSGEEGEVGKGVVLSILMGDGGRKRLRRPLWLASMLDTAGAGFGSSSAGDEVRSSSLRRSSSWEASEGQDSSSWSISWRRSERRLRRARWVRRVDWAACRRDWIFRREEVCSRRRRRVRAYSRFWVQRVESLPRAKADKKLEQREGRTHSSSLGTLIARVQKPWLGGR